MSTEEDIQFHPDRLLAYARWLLSQDPARLKPSDRSAVEFLRSEAGQNIFVKHLGEWERRLMSDEQTRWYTANLLIFHDYCLRMFGQLLPQPWVKRAAFWAGMGSTRSATLLLWTDVMAHRTCWRLFGRTCPEGVLTILYRVLAVLPFLDYVLLFVIGGFGLWWLLARR
jgi:hypothetical protein